MSVLSNGGKVCEFRFPPDQAKLSMRGVHVVQVEISVRTELTTEHPATHMVIETRPPKNNDFIFSQG